MKKRILSLVLLLTLLLTALPLQAQAAAPRIPIYVGRPDVDYLAEQLLQEIPTDGLPAREQIQAVYDWIIANCTRHGDNSKTYFDPAQVKTASAAFAQTSIALAEQGQIIFRAEMRGDSGTALPQGDPIDFDSNHYVAQYAYDMMRYRNGNCAHFSSLLTVLLGHLGFDCRVIHGQFINMDGTVMEHTWNYILVDGQYLWADIRIDHAVGGHQYFLWDDTDAWALEHTWDHSYSDWLREQEDAVALELQLSAEAGLGPWGMCSAWAGEAMQQAGQAGLIPASLDYQDLTDQITRGEFAAVSVRLYEALKAPVAPYQGVSPFSDTNDPDILRAYSLGVVNGLGDGRFGPDQSLTREQAVTMLGRVYELALTNAIADGSTLPQADIEFLDDGQISPYARHYVSFFVGQAIVDGMGDGSFAPQISMTREQALKVAVETVKRLG